MKLPALLAALLSLVTSCAQTSNYIVQAPQDGMPAALESTVSLQYRIHGEWVSVCSGVIVEHYVVTANHCLPTDGEELGVSQYDPSAPEQVGVPAAVKVEYADEMQDLAILSLISGEFPAGASLAPYVPAPGRPVVVIGHPSGLMYSVVTGVVSHPRRRSPDGQVYVHISAPVFFGNSGGPVFNGYGEVIGIVSFFVRTPHLAGATHLDEVMLALCKVTKLEGCP